MDSMDSMIWRSFIEEPDNDKLEVSRNCASHCDHIRIADGAVRVNASGSANANSVAIG